MVNLEALIPIQDDTWTHKNSKGIKYCRDLMLAVSNEKGITYQTTVAYPLSIQHLQTPRSVELTMPLYN
jgi:hypothetical protein